MFEGLFGGKEKRLQFFSHDDNTVELRRMPVEESSLVEKNNSNEIVRAYPLFHKSQYSFNGYGSIPADMVTLGYERDIILDPHNILKDDDKPEKGDGLVKEWIKNIAETQRYKIQSKPAARTLIDYITWLLLACAAMEAIGMLIRLLSARSGGGA